MNEFLIYIAKGSLVISFVYACYQLLLKANTHFAWNRAFLLVGILASILLPLWPVSSSLSLQSASVMGVDLLALASDSVEQAGLAERVDWGLWLGVTYLLGLFFMLFRISKIDTQIRKIIQSAPHEHHPQFILLRSELIQSPFSFYRYIFLPLGMEKSKEADWIIAHEKAHINGRHSLDILLIEFFLLFQWFNPMAWGYKKSLLAVHEYLADQSLIQSGINKSNYQLLLLEQSVGSQRFALANAFNEFTTIKRIKMMNQNKSSKWSRLKYLLLLPVLGLSLYSFKTLPSSTELMANITGQKVIKGHVVNAEDQSPIVGATVLVKESNVGILTNQEGYFEIMVPENSSTTLVFSFIGLADYQVKLANSGVLKVQLGKTMSSSKHSFFSPDKIEIDLNKEIKLRSDDAKAPLIILDGKEVKAGFDMDSINPDNIASVNVIKGEKALETYGEKGQNGVIEIITKKL